MAVVFNRRRFAGGGGFIIEGSGLPDGSTGKWSWTPGGAGSTTKVILDCEIKRAGLGTDQRIAEVDIGGSNFCWMAFTVDDTFSLAQYSTASYDYNYVTTQVFRDVGAYYNIRVEIDTTAASGSRVIIKVNGVQITDFGTESEPGPSAGIDWNAASVHNIAYSVPGEGQYVDAYISRYVCLDGQTTGDCGEFDDTGLYWGPIDASSLTFGTNGFLIEGGTDVAAGTDSSGNSNDFTPAGTITATSDSPTNDAANGYGNNATFSPLGRNLAVSSATLSNGNKTCANGAGGNIALSTLAIPETGSWWAAFTLDTGTASVDAFGINTLSRFNQTGSGGQYAGHWYGDDGNYYDGSSWVAYGATFTTEVIRVEVSIEDATIEWFKGNVSQGKKTSVNFQAGESYFFSAYCDGASGVVTADFADDGLSQTPTAGFEMLSTENFPTPDVPDYTTEYHVEKFTHNGTSHVITLPWNTSTDTMVRIKNVDDATGTADWQVFDTVRGDNESLDWNAQTAESTDANSCAFSGTSVTLGSYWDADDYLIEAFKVGSYFQITTYTGSGANKTESYPGTLDTAPGFLAVLSRTATGTFHPAWHTSIANTDYLTLDTTAASATAATMWNSTSPTTTQLSLGSNAESNTNSNTYVAYAWANSGPYAFGRYDANNSTDGPMLTLPGNPQTAVIKIYPSPATGNWYQWTQSLNEGNAATELLLMDTTAAVATSYPIDLVSNGVKLRSDNGNVNNAWQYVYMAFGITPIQGPAPSSSPNQGRAV